MPAEMERELKAEARKKGLKGKRANAYVYGTMRKAGWRPKTEKKSTTNIPGGSPHPLIETQEPSQIIPFDKSKVGGDWGRCEETLTGPATGKE